jgi:hypothetical protein
MKRELYLTDLSGDKDPRGISMSDSQQQAITGPYARPLLAGYKQDVAQYVAAIPKLDLRIASGFDRNDLGLWFEEALQAVPTPVFLESDVTRMDSSYCEEALRAARSAYPRDDGLFGSVLDGTYVVKRFTKSGLFIDKPGVLDSGIFDTTLTNSRTNCELYAKAYQITVNVLGEFVLWAIFLGDDGACVLEARAASIFEEVLSSVFASAGFLLKVKVHQRACHFEFLSGIFYPVSFDHRVRYFHGPKLGKVVPKLFTLKFDKNQQPLEPGSRLMREETKCRALSMERESKYIPVFKELIERVLSMTSDIWVDSRKMATYLMEHFAGFDKPRLASAKGVTFDGETLQFFCERYGVSPTDVQGVVAEINRCELDTEFTHPLWNVFIEKDN